MIRAYSIVGAALALAASSAAPAASDVHVCVDADGTVTYTNLPCRTGRQQSIPTPRPFEQPQAAVAATPAPQPEQHLPTVVMQPKRTESAVAAAPRVDTADCREARAAYRAAPRDTFSDGFEVKRRLDRVRDACAGSSPAAGAFDARTGEFYMLQGDQLVDPAQGRQLVR